MSDQLLSVLDRFETVNDRIYQLMQDDARSEAISAVVARNDLPVSHPDYFVSFKILPCVEIGGSVHRYNTLADARLFSSRTNPVFYSLYGHLESGHVEHIHNASNAVDASQFLTWMTGQKVAPSDDVIEMHVGTIQ